MFILHAPSALIATKQEKQVTLAFLAGLGNFGSYFSRVDECENQDGINHLMSDR
jgi:hypothetical protein